MVEERPKKIVREDKETRKMLSQITSQLKPLSELSMAIIMKADLQAYTEEQYDQLVALAHEGMAFLAQLQLGDTITSEWIKERDNLVERAQRLIADAPNASS